MNFAGAATLCYSCSETQVRLTKTQRRGNVMRDTQHGCTEADGRVLETLHNEIDVDIKPVSCLFAFGRLS